MLNNSSLLLSERQAYRQTFCVRHAQKEDLNGERDLEENLWPSTQVSIRNSRGFWSQLWTEGSHNNNKMQTQLNSEWDIPKPKINSQEDEIQTIIYHWMLHKHLKIMCILILKHSLCKIYFGPEKPKCQQIKTI